MINCVGNLTMENITRVPSPIDLGREYDFNMETLFTHYQKHLALKESGEDLDTATADRYACGYPIPPFQRDLVWTRNQEVMFIESAYLGLLSGSFCTHEVDWDCHDKALKFSGWLIDGQQRLTTIERYWNDAFKVCGLYYSELTPPEKRRFLRTRFVQNKVILNDEVLIKDLYNRMAFGGVPHKPEDYAA